MRKATNLDESTAIHATCNCSLEGLRVLAGFCFVLWSGIVSCDATCNFSAHLNASSNGARILARPAPSGTGTSLQHPKQYMHLNVPITMHLNGSRSRICMLHCRCHALKSLSDALQQQAASQPRPTPSHSHMFQAQYASSATLPHLNNATVAARQCQLQQRSAPRQRRAP
jgi:hypothetical protein